MGTYSEQHAESSDVVLHYCGDHRLSGDSGVIINELVRALATKLDLPNPRFDRQVDPGGAFIWVDGNTSDDEENRRVTAKKIDKYAAALDRGEYVFASLHMDCGCIGKRSRAAYLIMLLRILPAMQSYLPNQKVIGGILIDNDHARCTGGETFTYIELSAAVLEVIRSQPDIAREFLITEYEVRKAEQLLDGAHQEIDQSDEVTSGLSTNDEVGTPM